MAGRYIWNLLHLFQQKEVSKFWLLFLVFFFVLKKVLEICPVIDWDKGKAVTFLLESLGMLK